MRIHSDILTALDFAATASKVAPGVWLDECNERGSTSRARAFEVRLAANPAPGRMRRRNTGTHGAEDAWLPVEVVAATYAEHGRWFMRLFDIDPAAIIGPYKGVDDFHAKTKNAYKENSNG